MTAAAAAAATAVWYVYMLECADGALYTGVTPDVARRFEQHCTGRGAAYTRSNRPLRVVAAQACGSRSEAQRQESALKRLRRPQKLAWARSMPWTAEMAAGAQVATGVQVATGAPAATTAPVASAPSDL